MDGWDISTVTAYPTDLISSIPNTNNDQITFKQITCLKGDVSLNNANEFTADILPHFDIQFEMASLSPSKSPTNNPTTAQPTFNPSISYSINFH